MQSDSTSSQSAETLSTYVFQKFLPLSLSRDDIFQNTVFREVTEPVMIIQEYVRLLRRSCGRIIIVSGYSEGRFLCESVQ